MKQTNKVALLPEVYDFLDVLAQTLLEKDYVSYIEHGENIGHKLGFPTANIQLPDFHVVPKFGVYITKAKVGGKWYKAITNVGGKPTVGTNKPCIETYMLDFENDIYGEEIEIEFYHYLRPISKFENIEALKKQLAQDKESARVYFNEK